MKVIIGLLVFGLINYISSNPVQDENFKTFIKSMADSLNNTASPCTDFTTFACSKFKKPEPVPEFDPLLYVKILQEEPKTPVETIMQKFYQSCEKLAGNWPYNPDFKGKINLSKIFDQLDILKANPKWPAETNADANKLSVLLAETISIHGLSNYILIEPNNGKLEIFAPKIGEYPEYQKTSPKTIEETMKTYNSKNQGAIDKAVKDITDFETKLEAILKEKVETVSLPAATVVGLNWPELVKVLQKNWFLTGTMEPIVTDNRIVQIVKLITETDSKTIVNHLIYKIIDFVETKTQDGCFSQLYFQPGFMDRMWRDTISAEDNKNYIQTLNSFEKSFKELEKKLGSKDPQHETDQELEITRECFEKRDELFKQMCYDKVKIEDNNFLQSFMNIAKLPIESYKRNVRDEIIVKMMNIDSLLRQFKQMQLQNKPMMYYFATKHLQLWVGAFDSNAGWIKTTESEFSQCLETKQKVKIPSRDVRNVLKIFATGLHNLNDFNAYQKNLDKKQVELENEILKAHSLNHVKAYYISLKQSNCFEATEYLDIALANRKEFSDAFGCKVDQPMNPKEKCEVE